jgi:hypothetical protein
MLSLLISTLHRGHDVEACLYGDFLANHARLSRHRDGIAEPHRDQTHKGETVRFRKVQAASISR